MIKFRLFFGLLFIYVLVGCASTKELIPIQDKTKSYQVLNVSYKVPVQGDWYLTHESDHSVILQSGKDDHYETYVAKIELMQAGSLSNEAAYKLMKERFLSVEKSKYRDRYEIIDSKTYETNEKDIFCIKLYSKVKDYKPSRKPDDADYLILETLEQMCRHPKDASKFVVVAFSKRTDPNRTTPDFMEHAEDFFFHIEYL